MTGPDPQREPQSETEEKSEIHKSHEEFIEDSHPSMTKQEYEKGKSEKREKENEKRGPGPTTSL